MITRLQKLKNLRHESCFLWGPRQTGKSTLLKQLFPNQPYYDLLLSNEFERLNRRPATLREEVLAWSAGGGGFSAGFQRARPPAQPIIIDEIQKIPALLDEVHWLMVNRHCRFILCGSSARKLKHGAANLLGGRAIRHELFPLVYKEIRQFDLLRALNHGLLPRHYLAEEPMKRIQAYIGDYLREEIAAEALIRNIPAFGRFLEAASFSNGEIVNFTNIASDCGVSAPTVKEYFQILEDTLVARFLPAFQKKPKRRVIQSPKFYFFDLGIANFLLKRGTIVFRSEVFGKAFEHFIFQEMIAHGHYSGLHYPLAYWRTTSRLEVDFILGDHEVAVEVKATENVGPQHLKNLRAFMEEYSVKKAVVVSLTPRPRLIGSVRVLPWKLFLEALSAGEIIG